MVNRRKSRTKKRSYGRRFKKRISKAKLPVETVIAGGATIFTPATDGWGTPMQHMQDGAFELVAQDYAKGFSNITIPVNGQAFSFDIIGLLNPFDLNSARYTKMLFWSALASKARKKMVPQLGKMLNKIPLVGRWVS